MSSANVPEPRLSVGARRDDEATCIAERRGHYVAAMEPERLQLLLEAGGPEARGAVAAPREQRPTLGAEGDRGDAAAVAGECGDRLALLDPFDFPDVGSCVAARVGNEAPVGAPGDFHDRGRMAWGVVVTLAAGHVPDSDGIVLAGRGEQRPVRAECGIVHQLAAVVEPSNRSTAPRVPEVRALVAHGCQQAAVRGELDSLELGPRREHVQEPAAPGGEDARSPCSIDCRDEITVRRDRSAEHGAPVQGVKASVVPGAPDGRPRIRRREQQTAVPAERRGGRGARKLQGSEPIAVRRVPHRHGPATRSY